MKQFIYDYLSFTKKERRGIYVIVFLIIVCAIAPFLFPYFIKAKTAKPNVLLQQQIVDLQLHLDTTEQKTYANNYTDNNNGRFRDYQPKYALLDKTIKGELFNFDPNTLNTQGWAKLGVNEKTIATIQNYVSKGGKFFHPEDIGKIYSLSDAMVERLIPFVQIEKKQYEHKTYPKANYENKQYATTTSEQKKPTYQDFLSTYTIDINTADTTAWKKLPSIGSKLSARIVNYKNKLGGFLNVTQVAETFGLADSTFQKIKQYLQCTPNNVLTIPINTCTLEQLNTHPYISKSVANNIIQYRTQHGKFTNSNDLQKLALLTPEIIQKISPYLVFD